MFLGARVGFCPTSFLPPPPLHYDSPLAPLTHFGIFPLLTTLPLFTFTAILWDVIVTGS